MYVRLIDGSEIELPKELDLQERIDLCDKITKEHSDSFKYIMPKNSSDSNYVGVQASMRLELLGTYILDAVEKDKKRPVLSEYKSKRIAKNEVLIDF